MRGDRYGRRKAVQTNVGGREVYGSQTGDSFQEPVQEGEIRHINFAAMPGLLRKPLALHPLNALACRGMVLQLALRPVPAIWLVDASRGLLDSLNDATKNRRPGGLPGAGSIQVRTAPLVRRLLNPDYS